MRRGDGECALRDDRVRKDALRCRCAIWRVIRFAARNSVDQAIGQGLSQVVAIDSAGQRVGSVGEVTTAIGEGGYLNQSGLQPLNCALPLIVSKEEDLVLADRSARGASELVLLECRALGREESPGIEI